MSDLPFTCDLLLIQDFFSRIYKKKMRGEERRNPSRGREMNVDGEGESPDTKDEVAAGTPAEENSRREIVGGDRQAAAALCCSTSRLREARRGTGTSPRCV